MFPPPPPWLRQCFSEWFAGLVIEAPYLVSELSQFIQDKCCHLSAFSFGCVNHRLLNKSNGHSQSTDSNKSGPFGRTNEKVSSKRFRPIWAFRFFGSRDFLRGKNTPVKRKKLIANHDVYGISKECFSDTDSTCVSRLDSVCNHTASIADDKQGGPTKTGIPCFIANNIFTTPWLKCMKFGVLL